MMIYLVAGLGVVLVLLLVVGKSRLSEHALRCKDIRDHIATLEEKMLRAPELDSDRRVLTITLDNVVYRPAYNYAMAVLAIEYALRDLGIDKSSSKAWGIIADTIENKPIPEEHRHITNAIDRLPFSATPSMCRQVALDMLLASNDIQQSTIDTRIGTGERLQAWLNQSMR